MIRCLPFANVVAIVVFLAPTVRADDGPAKVDGAPPRYKLRVGQELNYQGTNGFKNDFINVSSKTSWKLLVVRQNADGGWRLLVRYATAQKRTSDKGQESFAPERASLAWCDLSRDGRIEENPTIGFTVDIRSVLPLLPPTAQAESWQGEDPGTGTKSKYAIVQPSAEAGHVEIQEMPKSALDNIFLSSPKRSFFFDTSRGLVDRVEFESVQEYKGPTIGGTAHRREILVSVQQRDLNWSTAVAVEMNDYFAVRQECDELVERAGKQPSRTAQLLATAKANLEDLRKALKTDIIQAQLDNDLANHARMASYTERQVQRTAEVLDKPSPSWETMDLTGTTRSIEACRGKVVILDFWYRGCGWCIRAMPQVQQVAAHFQGRPVEVFGMNTDKDAEDARFVTEKMAISYPTLKAAELSERYGVQGFPTLLIIDQEGVVRDIHVGYSRNLAKSVITTVEKLLARR
ncbi:MAG TPA: TlpA disulfide reductase family protein [Pirellulales bacterium]|jgi:thiol-disulfide isomerase/thioredoxin